MLYQPVITFPTALEKGYALILIFASVNKVGMELTARSTHVNTLIIVQVSLICDSICFDFSNSTVSYFSPQVVVFFNLFTLFFTVKEEEQSWLSWLVHGLRSERFPV